MSPADDHEIIVIFVISIINVAFFGLFCTDASWNHASNDVYEMIVIFVKSIFNVFVRFVGMPPGNMPPPMMSMQQPMPPPPMPPPMGNPQYPPQHGKTA